MKALKTVVIFGLLRLAFAHAVAAQSEVRNSTDLELNVMSFNIRYGTAPDGGNSWLLRRELVFEVLQEQQPDVVGLQETLRFQLDEIRARFPEYGEVGVGRDDGKTSGEYSAILYHRERFAVMEENTIWFSDTPDKPGSMHWGNKFPRICTWARLTEKQSGCGFYVYNVHLDHESQISREKSAHFLSEMIAKRAGSFPVVVTGDFNAGENNSAIQSLKNPSAQLVDKTASPLIDTFRILHPDADSVGTFHAFSGNRIGEKIDYIFVQNDARVLSAEINHDQRAGHYPSDHFPVNARILLPCLSK